MRIVPLSPALLPAVAALEQAVFSDPWSMAALADALESPAGLWFAALDEENRLTAYLGAALVAGEAELLRLAVAPEWRRQGLGAALAAALFSTPGLREVFLEVRCSNAPALALYTRLGFVPVGRRPGYYQNPPEDALILRYIL